MVWVILPGMDGTGELVARFAAALPREDVSVIVRYPRNRVMSLAELIRFIDETLPVTEDYVIVAESFSGPLAIQIATRNPPPKRLRGIVLSATFADCPLRGFRRLMGLILGGIAMRLNPPRFVIRKFLLDPNASDEEVEIVAGAIRDVKGEVMATRLKQALRADCVGRLERLKMPTLILAAKDDRLIAPEATAKLIDGIKSAEVVWMDGPHLLLLRRTEQAVDAVRRFVIDVMRREVGNQK
jgi:pimeloyl-ACP methyl ester carboxylesterase